MRRIPCALAVVALCACADATQPTQPARVAALARHPAGGRYDVVKLPTRGASPNRGSAINDRGHVAGYVTTTEGLRHAAFWRHGAPVDLGTLGGPHSNVQWPGLNERGMVVGIAQTAERDSLGEDWSCAPFLPSKGNVCLGFVWYDGVMRPLPTLGGTNGFATGVNNRGQVVGWAETPVHDPTCDAPQVLQFRAVVWEPRKGRLRELRPLRGDSTSAATAINERGEAVGISGECDVAVGRYSARRAVLWRHGRARKIPDLGGEAWHTPMDINERGDVVGFSNPPGIVGGAFVPRAFLWTGANTSINLGLLSDDDTDSQALGINNRRQVVGVSCKGSSCRGFLWEDGVMRDLKALVDPGFPDDFLSARHINDRGQITGNLLEKSTGRIVGYVATPRRGWR